VKKVAESEYYRSTIYIHISYIYIYIYIYDIYIYNSTMKPTKTVKKEAIKKK
jgi:uncharacterized protein YpmB